MDALTAEKLGTLLRAGLDTLPPIQKAILKVIFLDEKTRAPKDGAGSNTALTDGSSIWSETGHWRA
jgi:hypothetical protein